MKIQRSARVFQTLILFATLANPALCGDGKKFDVCINAWPNTVLHTLPSGRKWIDVAVDDYGATGIYLAIPWSFLETAPGEYLFSEKKYGDMSINIDGAVETILKKDLNLYVRIYFGSLPGDGILGNPRLPPTLRLDVSDTTNDFFRHVDGVAKKPGSAHGAKLVNFLSANGERRLLAAFKATVRRIKAVATSLGRANQLKEINPTLSWDDETEYPWQYFVDHSDPAQASFRKFLAGKYQTPENPQWFDGLLSIWGEPGNAPIPTSLEDIDTRKYNWSDAIDRLGLADRTGFSGFVKQKAEDYDFPGGRNDWMEFRTEELGKVVKKFSDICAREGIRCCIQIGSPFDFLIEKRGWQDITPLLQDVGGIRTANIAERKATFSFEADLVRSGCNFWTGQTGKEYVFSTETNWPEYRDFDAKFLCETWSEQLKSFYERGSDAHFVYGWGLWGKDKKGRRHEDYIEIFAEEYAAWRDTLRAHAGKPVRPVSSSKALYISTPRTMETHGYSSTTLEFADHCEYYMRAVDKGRGGHVYDETDRRDIITTYMLMRDPEYLSRYPVENRPNNIDDDIPAKPKVKE